MPCTSQILRTLTKKLLGKRIPSICETMNTFNVNTGHNMIGIFEV